MRVPERGEIVWLDFNPQAGREQAGRRPALVLTPSSYNRRSDLAIFCPLTSQAKGYPFEVALPEGLPIQGVILSDQARSLDWRSRHATRICVAPKEVLEDVLARLLVLISGEES